MTMVELLLVVTIIVILAVLLLIAINPTKQFQKAHDSKRKQELNQLTKTFNEFYNNKSRYPQAPEVCYTAPETDGETCSCLICGKHGSSPNFSPYMSRLPCDPSHPGRDYLYQYQCTQGTWFKLYSILSSSTTYSYGVSSENVSVEPYPESEIIPPTAVPPSPSPGGGSPDSCFNPTYCLKGGICNICGSPSACSNPATCDAGQYFSNSSCTSSCTIE